MVLKLASRSLTETVRATYPPARSPCAVRPDSFSSSRLIRSGSSMSSANGLLGADALLRRVRRHPALVTAPGQGGQVRALRGAQLALQGIQRGVRDVAHRPQAQPGEDLPGPLPHSPQRGDGQRVQEVEHPGLRHHQQAVRLAAGRGDLGHELAGRDPDRAGDALLLRDLGPDEGGDPGGRHWGPSRRSAPDTSRNASSSASGSTSGVIAPKMAMTSLEVTA